MNSSSRTSRRKLCELIERNLKDLELCEVMMDGISFDGEGAPGLDTQQEHLWVLEVAKTLLNAVRNLTGEAALIHGARCTSSGTCWATCRMKHQPFIEQKLIAAWG